MKNTQISKELKKIGLKTKTAKKTSTKPKIRKSHGGVVAG